MDPSAAALRRSLNRARSVLAFAESAGDENAIRIAATILADLLAQAEEHGAETGPAAPGPGAAARRPA